MEWYHRRNFQTGSTTEGSLSYFLSRCSCFFIFSILDVFLHCHIMIIVFSFAQFLMPFLHSLLSLWTFCPRDLDFIAFCYLQIEANANDNSCNPSLSTFYICKFHFHTFVCIHISKFTYFLCFIKINLYKFIFIIIFKIEIIYCFKIKNSSKYYFPKFHLN